jgi:TRAP-type transport system small permease protein
MKFIHSLCRFSGYVAMGVMGLMMLLTVADVFMRWVFNSPISGATELIELMMVVVVFPGLAYCALSGRHVRVDLLVSSFKPRIRSVIDFCTLVLGLFIYIIIAWQSLLEAMEVETTTTLVALPHAPFYWVLTFGFILLCLAIVTLIIEIALKEVKR